MLAITFGLGLVAIRGGVLGIPHLHGAGADIRSAVFKSVQAFSARDVDRFGTPSLITRNTNDIQQIQLFLQLALTMNGHSADHVRRRDHPWRFERAAALSPLLGSPCQ